MGWDGCQGKTATAVQGEGHGGLVVGSSSDGEAMVSIGGWPHGVGSGCDWDKVAMVGGEKRARTRVVKLFCGRGQWWLSLIAMEVGDGTVSAAVRECRCGGAAGMGREP